jgi:thymidine kinase
MALIKYITGPMYAGKSSLAYQMLQKSHHLHKIIVSPTARLRGYVSRNHNLASLDLGVILLEDTSAIAYDWLQSAGGNAFIMVDESHFMDDQSFWQLLSKAKNTLSIDIVLAGVHYDQHGEPFSNYQAIKNLFTDDLCLSLTSTCATCSSPDGIISIRKWRHLERKSDDYAVLCRSCFDNFYHQNAPNSDSESCDICAHRKAKYRLRHWKHEASLVDSYADLCSHCYPAIIDYGSTSPSLL